MARRSGVGRLFDKIGVIYIESGRQSTRRNRARLDRNLDLCLLLFNSNTKSLIRQFLDPSAPPA